MTLDHLKIFLSRGIFKIFCEYIKNKNNLKNNNLLVVSHVFNGTDVSKNKIIREGSILEEVNNIKLKSLNHYKTIILENKHKYLKFKQNNKLIEVIDFKNSLKNEIILSENNNYPLDSFVKTLLINNFSSNKSKKIPNSKNSKKSKSKKTK